MYRDRDQREFARRLRNQMTEAERCLWHFLRAQRLDGPQHGAAEAAQHDAERTAWLAESGYRVVRFWNHQLDEEFRQLVEQIRGVLAGEEANVSESPLPIPPRRGEGAGTM